MIRPGPHSTFRCGALALLGCLLLVAGCVGPDPAERAAKARLGEVGAILHPARRAPALPALTAESSLADYVRFAVLNHPQVEATYDEWQASVSAIAPARVARVPEAAAFLPDEQQREHENDQSEMEHVRIGVRGEAPEELAPGKKEPRCDCYETHARQNLDGPDRARDGGCGDDGLQQVHSISRVSKGLQHE